MKNVCRVLATVVVLCMSFVSFGLCAERMDTIRINCPLTEAKTEVTTPLPPGWWNTPQTGKLIGTHIESIAGKNTLVCAYWAYNMPKGVAIMHLFPEGSTNCRPDMKGFTCNRPGSEHPVKTQRPLTNKMQKSGE